MTTAEKNLSAARGGFTLVELLLVIAILGVLAAGVVMNFGGVAGDARANATRDSIRSIETAAAAYEVRVGRYPNSVEDLKSSADGMRPLLDPKKPTQDGWGNEFQLRIVDNGFLEVRSAGEDGQMNTSDDITNRGK